MGGRTTEWGWYRLDAGFAELLVDDAALRRGDLVIDIGAGDGALVEPLLRRGLRVLAVERHPLRLAELRRRFGENAPPGCRNRIVIVDADAGALRLPRQPFHVVANPPFAVSSALLRRLLQPGSRLLSGHIVLPRQVIRRWTEPGAPGAGRWQRNFAISAGRRLPRHAFAPPPRTNCGVLVIRRRGTLGRDR